MKTAAALAPLLNGTCQALQQASTNLRDELASLEHRLAAITEYAKTLAVRHIAVRTNEVARMSIAQQSRAMADAARVAFKAERGATLQRLQTTWDVDWKASPFAMEASRSRTIRRASKPRRTSFRGTV